MCHCVSYSDDYTTSAAGSIISQKSMLQNATVNINVLSWCMEWAGH